MLQLKHKTVFDSVSNTLLTPNLDQALLHSSVCELNEFAENL